MKIALLCYVFYYVLVRDLCCANSLANDACTNNRNRKTNSVCEDGSISTLTTWTKNHAFVSEKVRIGRSQFVSGSYGVIATDHINKQEIIFSAPENFTLTAETCSISNLLRDADHLNSDNDDWIKRTVCLMHEYTNPLSRWKPYLEFVVTNQHLDLPIFWSIDQIHAYFKGTGFSKYFVERKLEVNDTYTDLVMPFLKANKHVGLNDDGYSYELFKKMLVFTCSRSYTYGMVPFADMFNHKSKANIDYFDVDNHSQFMVYAMKNIKPGEELFMTYGKEPNIFFLLHYGFAEEYPNNVYDEAHIPVTALYRAAKRLMLSCVPEKISWLQHSTLQKPY